MDLTLVRFQKGGDIAVMLILRGIELLRVNGFRLFKLILEIRLDFRELIFRDLFPPVQLPVIFLDQKPPQRRLLPQDFPMLRKCPLGEFPGVLGCVRS